MGRVKENSSVFNENYFGVLDHTGSFRVAKTEIKQKILNIGDTSVQVMGRNKSYHTEIHKDLYSLMDFVTVGDYAYVKFKRGKAWFVGFQKQKAEKSERDWQSFLEGVDVE